jgi:hypothetical protein
VVARLELEVFGEVQLKRHLLNMGDRVRDMRPFFHELVDFLEAHEKKQFQTEGRHASGGWAELAASTIAAKRREGFGSKGIMRRTDALFDALTKTSARGAVRDITPDSLHFSVDLDWPAGVHQHGSGNLPRRRLVELDRTDRKQIGKAGHEFIVKGATKLRVR